MLPPPGAGCTSHRGRERERERERERDPLLTMLICHSRPCRCRLHESQMHLWRAMVSGPEGTPYSGGLFLFDIFCPSDYPNAAPKVNLCTTGGSG